MFERGPNLLYNGLDHDDAGELVSAVRDWLYSVVESDDRERVDRLLNRLESAVDVVLVEKRSPIAVEPGGTSGLTGGPAGGVCAGGDVS